MSLRRAGTALANGALLRAAEEAGFEAFVTADRNLRHRQNLGGRTLAVGVLGRNKWALIQHNIRILADALASSRPSDVVEVDLGFA